jgi:Zn-finger nucleic acid-binding protein
MSQTCASHNTTAAFSRLDTTSALRPLKLTCPACRRSRAEAPALESCAVGKVDLHRCRTCGGVWFQDKCVDEALEAIGGRSWPGPEVVPAPPLSLPLIKGEKTEASPNPIQDWLCPCCGGALVMVLDPRGRRITIRRCLVCYGGWIEHKELLRAPSPPDGMLARIGRLFMNLLFV